MNWVNLPESRLGNTSFQSSFYSYLSPFCFAAVQHNTCQSNSVGGTLKPFSFSLLCGSFCGLFPLKPPFLPSRSLSNWTFPEKMSQATDPHNRATKAAQLRLPRRLLPALAGRCGNPGDTVFLCRAGCCGDRRRGSVRVEVTKEVVVTRAPPGLLLNWRAAAAAF